MDNTAQVMPRRLDPARRRLRARLGGEWLFDTLEACLFYEKGRHPVYAIPFKALDRAALVPALPEEVGAAGDGQWWSLGIGGQVRPAVVRTWSMAPADLPILKKYAAIEMSAADAWYEEDTEVFYKPRDPFRRVEILESSRQVRVEVYGVIVAETRRPRLVLETGLPEQWYIPRPDINWTYLAESHMQSRCQYKGKARYWDVIIDDQAFAAMAWSYEETVVEASALAALVGFPRTHESVKTFVDNAQLKQTIYSPDWHNPSMAVGEHP